MLDKLANKLLPIATKLAQQRHLSAVKDSFIISMPLIMAASLFVLLNALGANFFHTDIFSGIATIANQGTLGVLSILIAFTTANNLAEYYLRVKPELAQSGFTKIHAGGLAVALMFILMPVTQSVVVDGIKDPIIISGMFAQELTSSSGLIYSLLTALIGTEIFVKLASIRCLRIKMPDNVPPAIEKSFNALIPELITITIFTLLVFGLDFVWGVTVPDIITAVISKPLSRFVLSSPGLIFLQFISDLLWVFGIHGAPILSPIRTAPMLEALTENIAASGAGNSIPNIVTEPFMNMYGLIGGGGCVLALIIAIFIVSKRQDHKTVAKLGLVPSLFNISEPIMFGLPVVMNPIFMIPAIIVPSINLIIAYIMTNMNLVGRVVAQVPWITPPGFYAFFATGGDFMAAILSLVLLALDVIIYVPFVKVSNKVEQSLDNQDNK
ncbi:PTS sugar transporter subunit IIC [Candidatus Stoquefichus massiliensis]|uniref:PTS sugar transporter subunit IIC n=1 Tax=Candidatus Stoquefichus massiliensis TaxID=1470350 RepID=UPI0004815BD6|nr:PTS transporter subunit EIIC [Candidatus Stoquefichus massiliensis]